MKITAEKTIKRYKTSKYFVSVLLEKELQQDPQSRKQLDQSLSPPGVTASLTTVRTLPSPHMKRALDLHSPLHFSVLLMSYRCVKRFSQPAGRVNG